ncbi:MAG: pantetheine-phosphate adenylyltransferase [Flavobacteriales bacterium]
MKKGSAIYAFSADPITYGHIDIIERAAKIFNHVVVAIGQNPAKKHLFSLEEREKLTIEALAHLNNVQIKTFEGMFSHFAKQENITVNLKGLRNIEDYEYERTLHEINKNQNPELDSLFIPASASLRFISSGAVKAIVLAGGNIESYAPLGVRIALERKLENLKPMQHPKV